MAKTRVLITVKTYPTLSGKYDELVCTAGFREDGSWIRIYPIQFRQKSYDQQYSKYDWIEIDLTRNTSDFRPDTFRPVDLETEINVIDHLDTGSKRDWAARKDIVLQNVYEDMSVLISEAKNKEICTSLAVFKPTKILDFTAEPVEREWDEKKLLQLNQLNLFNHMDDKGKFEVVKKLPYKFKYRFKDSNGDESNMMIEDWEVGQLYWRQLAKYDGDEVKAIADVRLKYFDHFVNDCDLYFFLGTSKVHHFTSRNPFMIIGAFYPPKSIEGDLFKQ